MAESRSRLQLAVEDRFLLVRLNENDAMLPEDEVAERVAATIASFSPSYTIVCDSRGVDTATTDVLEMAQAMEPYNPVIIDHQDRVDWVRANFGDQARFLPLIKGELPLRYEAINLVPFEHEESIGKRRGIAEGLDLSVPSEAEWNLIQQLSPYVTDIFPTYEELVFHWDISRIDVGFELGIPGGDTVLGRRLLDAFITKSGRNSLLTQYAFQFSENDLVVTPYHSHAIYSVESEQDLILARPSVIAKQTQTLFRQELNEFERILQEPKQREYVIQKFLEEHPQILQAMGYTNIYAQVVLERDDGTSLRPDFILEPIGEDWYDIVDIKLPSVNMVVGPPDRKTFSAAIHALAAQLREYAAYFENESWAKRVEEKYGIRCYRPRLIGIVGTNPNTLNDRELRRLMTAYDDLSVLTFDRLLEIAKSRLLI